MNPFILVIIIPLVILGAVALNHYLCKKITEPYQAAPSFLDDLPDLHKPKKEPFWYSHKDYK